MAEEIIAQMKGGRSDLVKGRRNVSTDSYMEAATQFKCEKFSFPTHKVPARQNSKEAGHTSRAKVPLDTYLLIYLLSLERSTFEERWDIDRLIYYVL